jgi:hypothetical protein
MCVCRHGLSAEQLKFAVKCLYKGFLAKFGWYNVTPTLDEPQI